MPLGARAAAAVPPLVPAVPIFCHTATWYYAAKEAQAKGLTAPKADAITIGNIGALGGQAAIVQLAQNAGTWDFNRTANTPPVGSVLVWLDPPTHSATVTAANQISGYNQVNQFAGSGLNHSTRPVGNLAGNQRVVKVIPEDTIVKEAGRLNL